MGIVEGIINIYALRAHSRVVPPVFSSRACCLSLSFSVASSKPLRVPTADGFCSVVSVIAVEHSSKRVLPTWQSSKSSYAVVTTTHPGFLDSTHLPSRAPLSPPFSSLSPALYLVFSTTRVSPPFLFSGGSRRPRSKRGDSERNGSHGIHKEYETTFLGAAELRATPFFLCLPPPRPFSLLFFFIKGKSLYACAKFTVTRWDVSGCFEERKEDSLICDSRNIYIYLFDNFDGYSQKN